MTSKTISATITMAENSLVIFRHIVCISVTMYVNAYVYACVETNLIDDDRCIDR